MTRNILISSLAASIVCAMSTTAQAQSARDSINIVGSSTVYPFTTTVAEQFGRAASSRPRRSRAPAPAAASSCSATASARSSPTSPTPRAACVRPSSQTCQKNGVKDVVEIKVGYDGIVLAESKAGASLDAHAQGRVPRAREERAGSGEPDAR